MAVSQAGQPLRTSTSWDLSADNPLAVVVDAPAASLAKAQGLVAELVQEAPPALPLLLASGTGLTAGPGVNRDALMSALAKQRPGTATSVADGIQTSAAAGVQHVLVISTCAAAPPAQAPTGVVVDVLGVGSACSPSWAQFATSGPGTFTAATNFDLGLAALDATVARWRSSVVVVTQALTREPLLLSVGARPDHRRAPGGAAEREPTAAAGRGHARRPGRGDRARTSTGSPWRSGWCCWPWPGCCS